VGDLVDRGPKNVECASLLYEPWFHAVQGNHEQLMYRSILDSNSGYGATWIGNGGGWFTNVSDDVLTGLSLAMQELPLVISVGEGDERFNIVHAELKHDILVDEDVDVGYKSGVVAARSPLNQYKQRVPLTDEIIDAWPFDYYEENDMVWGRGLVGNKQPGVRWHHPTNMSLTFVGHTPVRPLPVQFGQQVYIDLGACFTHYNKSVSHDNALVMVEPKAKLYYRYGMVVQKVTEHSLDAIEKFAQ
jgi:serine/threonine protein phosphatase 1